MDDATDYRPVSRLAVAALVAGGCSALALVTRFAWMLPLLGVGLAAAALLDVSRPGRPKAGRLMALGGLALAAGFGAQAVSDSVVDRWLTARRASAAAAFWLDAVREGRWVDALSICGPGVLPAAAPSPGAGPPAAEDRADEFAALPAVMAVTACGATARPTIMSAVPDAGDGWLVRIGLTACGRSETLRLLLAATTDAAAGGVERWRVYAAALE